MVTLGICLSSAGVLFLPANRSRAHRNDGTHFAATIFPKAPRAAVETLTRYFRYCANLTCLNQPLLQVGCIIKNADLLVPAL